MSMAKQAMPEPTDEELEARERTALAWQEWQWNYDEDRQSSGNRVAIAGWLDVPGMWSPSAIAEYCTSVTPAPADMAHQPHISRPQEYDYLLAEMYIP